MMARFISLISFLITLLFLVEYSNADCPKAEGPGTCDEACSSTNDCEKGEECCSNGCGHHCICTADDGCGEKDRVCTEDEDCEDDYWCRLDQNADGSCHSSVKRCVEYQEIGDRCGGYTPECWSQRCPKDLECDQTANDPMLSDQPGKCSKSCEKNSDCDDDSWCKPKQFHNGTCHTEKECVKYQQLDEVCSGMKAECALQNCHPSLACESNSDATDMPGKCKQTCDGRPVGSKFKIECGECKCGENGKKECKDNKVQCVSDPCQNKVCEAYPDAKCKANYCGGCKQHWELHDKKVSCQPKSCRLNKKEYTKGQSYQQVCNTCICTGTEAEFACTEMACNGAKPEQIKKVIEQLEETFDEALNKIKGVKSRLSASDVQEQGTAIIIPLEIDTERDIKSVINDIVQSISVIMGIPKHWVKVLILESRKRATFVAEVIIVETTAAASQQILNIILLCGCLLSSTFLF